MKNILLDLSGKVDSSVVSVLEAVERTAASLRIPFFVVGATARDVILSLGYGIDTGRATMDIDLAVQVSSWTQFERLSEGMIATGRFSRTQTVQRLSFENHWPVDILPFGSIGDTKDAISWPPDYEIKMSVAGFEECYEHSLIVRLRSDPDLDVRFASPAGLAVLKLLSWNDSYPERRKDAEDLFLIMRTYCDAGNLERLYDENADIFETEGVDFELACARLLGRDIGQMLSAETKSKILGILEHESNLKSRQRLVGDMVGVRIFGGDTAKRASALLLAMKLGIAEL